MDTTRRHLQFRATAYEAIRIIRAERGGSAKYAAQLRRRYPLASRMVPYVERYIDVECMAVAMDKAAQDFAASLL